jgi:hypothetical protein
MLSAIRFLEQIGREGIPGDYASAVAALDVTESQRLALSGRDQEALVTLLGAPTSMFFGIFAPEEQPAEDEPARETPEEPMEDPERQD